jgi:hypothetical protein
MAANKSEATLVFSEDNIAATIRNTGMKKAIITGIYYQYQSEILSYPIQYRSQELEGYNYNHDKDQPQD